jgi:hypothetical protein
MQFIDGGKRFICCFCEAATDGSGNYFFNRIKNLTFLFL